MPIIALTGGIGSGKSEATRLFEKLRVPIIDTDVISHNLTGPNQAAIAPIKAQLGVQFINAQGALDRAKMREHVFQNPQARHALESIIHPLIHAQVKRDIQTNHLIISKNASFPQYQIIVVPLLFESNNYKNIADFTLVINCSQKKQVERAMARSNLSQETVNAIIKAQVSQATRLRLADEVIDNNGSIDALKVKIHEFHHKYNKICSKLASATIHPDNLT